MRGDWCLADGMRRLVICGGRSRRVDLQPSTITHRAHSRPGRWGHCGVPRCPRHGLWDREHKGNGQLLLQHCNRFLRVRDTLQHFYRFSFFCSHFYPNNHVAMCMTFREMICVCVHFSKCKSRERAVILFQHHFTSTLRVFRHIRLSFYCLHLRHSGWALLSVVIPAGATRSLSP